MVWGIVAGRKGETPRELARRLKPESFADDGSSWFLDMMLAGMSAAGNLVADELTRRPLEEDDVTVAGATEPKKTKKRRPKMNKGRAKAAQSATDARGAGEHSEEAPAVPKKRWADADLRELDPAYDPETFMPGEHAFDGDAEGVADVPFSHAIAVRVPVVHDEIVRHLSDAAGLRRLTPLELVLVICELHGRMRMNESNGNLLFAVSREREGGGRESVSLTSSRAPAHAASARVPLRQEELPSSGRRHKGEGKQQAGRQADPVPHRAGPDRVRAAQDDPERQGGGVD
mmetsp:Transcript_30729/g.98261  ORF Transcript_30729/g.98261 Transcript_30729/m.98261 type:complete len:288 (+) Transcript_30729:431-1294(+)